MLIHFFKTSIGFLWLLGLNLNFLFDISDPLQTGPNLLFYSFATLSPTHNSELSISKIHYAFNILFCWYEVLLILFDISVKAIQMPSLVWYFLYFS